MGLIIKGPPSQGYHHFPYDIRADLFLGGFTWHIGGVLLPLDSHDFTLFLVVVFEGPDDIRSPSYNGDYVIRHCKDPVFLQLGFNGMSYTPKN